MINPFPAIFKSKIILPTAGQGAEHRDKYDKPTLISPATESVLDFTGLNVHLQSCPWAQKQQCSNIGQEQLLSGVLVPWQDVNQSYRLRNRLGSLSLIYEGTASSSATPE